MAINIYDSRIFNTGNYRLVADPYELIIDSIAVMLGDYRIERKMAANLILKILIKKKFRRQLFEDKELYPYKRSDYRVSAWRDKVLANGKCEICGKTENLEAHHVLHWADYPMGRIDIKNGMCICVECHANEHVGESCEHLIRSKKKKVIRC